MTKISTQKNLYHYDNAPVHTSTVVMENLQELKFELLPHSPYSPDLARSPFFIPKFKNLAQLTIFLSNEYVIIEFNGYFQLSNDIILKNKMISKKIVEVASYGGQLRS